MNIKISYQHLKKYLFSSLDAEEFAKIMSESVASVERIDHLTHDTIFEYEITPNRIDLASAIGLARDMHAALQFRHKDSKLQIPTTSLKLKTDFSPKYLEIDKKLVTAYACILLENVSNSQSNSEVQTILTNMGVHCVSPLVDISNFVNYDFGIPIHIFDFDKLGGRLKIRLSKAGELIELLDGSKIELQDGEIVGENSRGELCDLCGVMGGNNSAVEANTKNILIWVPLYEKLRVRQSSLRHQKRTLASEYFEKDLDISILPAVVERTVELILQISPSAKKGIYFASATPPASKVVTTTQSKIQNLIGTKISPLQIKSILELLGFSVSNTVGDQISVRVPSYRYFDIEGEADIVEEVARLYGYQNLPPTPTPMVALPRKGKLQQFILEEQLRNFLAFCGWGEVITYSLTSSEILDKLALDKSKLLKVSETISEDFQYLRTHMLCSLLPVLQQNRGFFSNLKIFEFGKIYLPQKNALPLEKRVITLVANDSPEQILQLLDNLQSQFHFGLDFQRQNIDKFLSPNSTCLLLVGKQIVGHIGLVSAQLLDQFDLSGQFTFLEFDQEKLFLHLNTKHQLEEASKFAIITRDLSFTQKQSSFGQISDKVLSIDKSVKNVFFVGEYEGNYTIRINFTDLNQNISDKQVNEIIVKIEAMLSLMD